EVSLICLGPLTNLALSLKASPLIASEIKSLYFMGGNYQSVGNTNKAAEFNFYMDPESAFVVLDRVKSKPVYCVPWETCKHNCIISFVSPFDKQYAIMLS
ncbi:Inosine-uridine preferring nucleoside hydrolase, partial [Caligus rogercresseyi]